MNNNYLKMTRLFTSKGGLDYCTSTNFDEDYRKIYPKLSPKQIFALAIAYPDPDYRDLTQKINSKFKVSEVVLGAGCEDLIIKSCQIIKEKNWKVGVVLPTFYRIIDNLGKYTNIPAKEFGKRNYRNLQALWIVNPNPLSGDIIDKNILLNIIRKNPITIFLIDETAIFFLQNWRDYSLLSDYKSTNNFVVLTSLSKLYGISGLRAGFATGNKTFLADLKAKNSTFPVTNITNFFVQKILDEDKFFENIRTKIDKNKRSVEKLLALNPNIEIKKSVTNCVFARFKNSRNLFKELLNLGIVGLNLDTQPGIDKKGFVRLTVHSSQKRHPILMDKLTKLK